MSKIIGFAVLAFAAVGCAATETEDGPAPGASEEAITAVQYFDCNGGDAEYSMHRIEVGYSAAKLTVTDISKDAAPPSSGTFDPSYNPSSATYAGSHRYLGFDELYGDQSAFFMVSKELQDGATAGKIWMRTTASDGGGTTTYWCKAKDKKLAVDTHKNARLMCDLNLLCTDDNPPGSTCITTAFIQQTAAGSSKLRTEYYDHFGVHVVERKVDVGASNEIDRTTKSFKGEWAGHKADLKYRGGITYEGTFTMPDGRATPAKCNDLAMLD